MKTNTTVHIFLMLFAVALFTTACNNTSAKSDSYTASNEMAASEVAITPLLARSGKVGSEQEANKMFNVFQSIKEEILRNPNNFENRLKMADLYIVEARATGNYGYYYPAAVRMIDGVLAENPEDKDDLFRALTSKAVILLSYHKFEEAREIGRQALKVNPHNSRVYGILTDANVEMGDYEQAVTMADSMVAIRPDLRSYSRVSYLREIFGDVAGAKQAMKMAIKAGAPGHEETTWARVTLGNIHESYGELDSASQQYQQALASRKGYPFALQGMASIAVKKGNFQDGEDLLRQALENREEAAFYEDLAQLYNRTGESEKMKQAREQAFAQLKGLAGESDHSHSHEDGDHHHAESNETASHGHSHEVGLEMADLYLALSDNYEEALHHALHEYQRRPANLAVNKTLAEAYLLSGKVNLASEHLAKAMATQSQDPELKLLQGLIKARQGSTGEAEKLIEQAFSDNPHLQGALATEARRFKGNVSPNS